MSKLKFILFLLFAITFSTLGADASNLDSMIKRTYLDKTSTISVSVRDLSTGKSVYAYNQFKLMNPASVQKLFTMRSAYKQLGSDFVFRTAVYIDNSNNLYLKLSGDPSLTTSDLITLFKEFKSKCNKSINDVVIDPTVTDNKQWGIGWMWDDDVSELLPKYSPFSVNENKIVLTVSPSKSNSLPLVKNNSKYQMNIVNKLKNGSLNNIVVERAPWTSGDTTYLIGTVKSDTQLTLPVNVPEQYFTNELKYALSKSDVKYSGAIKVAPTPQHAEKVIEITSSSLSELIAKTLKESNNFYSEMIFKAAGGSFSKRQGTTEDAVNMFEKEFSYVYDDGHVVVDACGISRNNLMSADWITSALYRIYKDNDFKQFVVLLPKPMEGTLANRLLNISLNLRAKTGTASGISSISGYIDSKSGAKYSFAILIQNHNINPVEVKKFEDKIINEIYKM